MSEWVGEGVSGWVSEWVTFTVLALLELFSSFCSLDMLGRCLLCTDSVVAALKLDNILVFSTPKSIVFFVLLYHRFLHLIFHLMILSSAATWQKPKISLARTEDVIPLRRVSNIPHTWFACFTTSLPLPSILFLLLLKLTVSLLSSRYLLVLILSNNHADDNTHLVSQIDSCV